MANSAVSPRQHIMRFMGSVQVARAISAVAELGVADALADGPLTPDDLAARTGADAGALHRLLRLLASNGIFAEDEMGRFALTPAADPLRTDIPGSLRDSVRCAWQDLTWAAFGQILHTARTGQSGFEAAFGR